jgi:predicted nucleic acid-binding protein
MPDYLLDSDVVIWFLRGNEAVVAEVVTLGHRGRLGISAITRTEIIHGMRDRERGATLEFLNACETVPVGSQEADCAGEQMRMARAQGITLSLPDAMIGATALVANIPLVTGNLRHFPMPDLDVRALIPSS